MWALGRSERVGGLGLLFVAAAVVWVAFFGVPCAWLAEQKGRSSLDGLVVGSVFGIVGILVIGLAPEKPSSEWVCPRCAEAIRPQASMCPHCRIELDPAV
jgi:hypothetical protein